MIILAKFLTDDAPSLYTHRALIQEVGRRGRSLLTSAVRASILDILRADIMCSLDNSGTVVTQLVSEYIENDPNILIYTQEISK